MRRRWVRQAIVVAVVVIGISAAAYAVFWYIFERPNVASNIVDFAPTSFPARADAKFFYSVGQELKYSDQIEVQAPTLIRGRVEKFLVSPDGEKIAVVVNRKLLVVGTDSILAQVADVDNIFRDDKPIGQQFFRDRDFQWSRDSRELYLIKDEYSETKGVGELFSQKGELWMYDLDSKTLKLVIKPFRAFSYFFGSGRRIYYSEPTERGDLQLKYFDGKVSKNVGEPNAPDIRTFPGIREEVPFYSFSIIDHEKALGSSKHVRLVSYGSGPERLIINDKPYVTLSQGQTFKGPYYCSDLLRSAFLPGDRFFLFNVPYCENYEGQLLIDTASGKYETLPRDTVVFITLNTQTFKNYRITGGGIVVPEPQQESTAIHFSPKR